MRSPLNFMGTSLELLLLNGWRLVTNLFISVFYCYCTENITCYLSKVLTFTCWIVSMKYEHVFTFYIMNHHWNRAGVTNEINWLALGRCGNKFISMIFKFIIQRSSFSTCIKIGLSNCLVPSGTKPLPEPILTLIYVAIWRHKAAMSFTSP